MRTEYLYANVLTTVKIGCTNKPFVFSQTFQQLAVGSMENCSCKTKAILPLLYISTALTCTNYISRREGNVNLISS